MRNSPIRSSDPRSPCTPPPQAIVATASTEALSSSLCDTPRPIKVPSENGIGRKRVFGFVEDGAAGAATKEIKGVEQQQEVVAVEAEAPQEESRSTRPSRQCKEHAVKRMRSSDDPGATHHTEEDYISDRATPCRELRRPSSSGGKHDLTSGTSSSTKTGSTPSDTRNKGPCSYEHCPNPTHSSGGGFKVVSMDTKAGNRDWSCYAGRTFCNACFTQFATRGTLQRPGRLLNPAAIETAAYHGEHRAAPSVNESSFKSTQHDNRAAHIVPTRPVRVRTMVEVEEGITEATEATAVVELELTCVGPNLQYQWVHDGRVIQGATLSTLLLENPRGMRGEITCKVSNAYGAVAPFAPIRLPLTLAEARKRYTMPVMPSAASYELTCVCGLVREGPPEELVVPCKCGLAVCGSVRPLYSKEEKAQIKTLSLYDDVGGVEY